MPLIAPFETSFERTSDRRIILIRLFDEDGADGWGECTAPEHPYYNHEFVDGAWLVLRDYLIPGLLGRGIGSASEVAALFRRVRGHRMAQAGLEAACWDLEARRRGQPLWHLIGGARSEIECGVSIGIQASAAVLVERIGRELASGYRRIKMKIKPSSEYEMIKAVRREFPDIRLMADANSAYTLSDLDTLKRLDDFRLMMIEQPLAHDDLIDHAELQKRLATPICLDESINGLEDTRKALSIGACKIINVKLGRVGGHGLVQVCEAGAADFPQVVEIHLEG
jgi:O-succinylbenzoate synthase